MRTRAQSRHHNRVVVLDALLRSDEVSRADLIAMTGLNRTAISEVLAEAADAGLLRQRHAGVRATGRPPLLVSLAADAGLLVGVEVGAAWIGCAVCDLSGDVVAQHGAPARPGRPWSVTADILGDLTSAAIARAGCRHEDVVGVGVSLATAVGAGHDALARELRDRLGLPVEVLDAACAGAAGEYRFGAGRGATDLLYLGLSERLGLGLILQGCAYGAARAIGHVTAVPDGRRCRCGKRGCLQTVASSVAVRERLGRDRGEVVSRARLLELVRAGDEGAGRAVAEAGEHVGRTMAATVQVLNPQVVIAGGELAEAGDLLLEPLREAVGAHCVVGELGARAESVGAAARLLDRVPAALARRLGEVRAHV